MKKAIIKMKNNLCQEERDKLVLNNTGLVYKITQKYAGKEYDDALSEGFLALTKASINYNPEICTFSTFAYHVIKNAVINFLKKEVKVRKIFKQGGEPPKIKSRKSNLGDRQDWAGHREHLPGDTDIEDWSGKMPTLLVDLSDVASGSYPYWVIDKLPNDWFVQDIIDRCRPCLTSNEYMVIKSRYLPDGTRLKHKEIQKFLDVSSARITQLEQSALKKIKKFLLKNYPSEVNAER